MIYLIQRAIDVVRLEQHNATPFFRAADIAHPIHLIPRDREIMSWAARGKTVQDIADILRISAETVEWHFKRALKKLDATNETHSIAR